MKPVPIVFHIGPLQVHTYGIGLAITFWVALLYFNRRLRARGYRTDWTNAAFLWIVGAAIVGARVVHVVANAGYYTAHPVEILAVWHGGLSSFGGLLFAIPTGIWAARRWCKDLPVIEGLDIVAPVLMGAWALGRLLGPQLMIAGGGHPTTAWYGLEYAGQVGKRIPVPIFQSAESLGVLLILLWFERRGRSLGIVDGSIAAAMVALWPLSRFFDEYFWLAVPKLWDAVEVTGLVLSAAGWVWLGILWKRRAPRSAAGEATPAEAEAASSGHEGLRSEAVTST